MSNCDPQTLQNPAWNVPRTSKIEVLEVPGSLNSRKRRPRPAKRCPRSTQESPRAVQECPKAGQVAPKSWPRRPQTLPKPRAVTSKTSFQHNLCWQLCAKGFWSDFVSFFCSCGKLAICNKPRKTWEKLWFLHMRSIFALQACACDKTLESEASDLPKLPPGAPKSHLTPPKTPKKNEQHAPKTAHKRPRRSQE